MRILDLFCGVGGASMGYHKAFPEAEIGGVDIARQPNYPFAFVQMDAMEFCRRNNLAQFDLIHASPPCQGYSHRTTDETKSKYPRLIEPIREILIASGVPYVIENVMGAKKYLRHPIYLEGGMFNRPKRRRYFECSFPVNMPESRNKTLKQWGKTYGCAWRKASVTGRMRMNIEEQMELWGKIMGIDWAKHPNELREAIYPDYTEYLGRQLYALQTNRS